MPLSCNKSFVYLSIRALALSVLFNACAFVWSVHKVFETATFCRPRCCIISKVLADWTWSFRFLFIALSGLLIVIYIPFRLAMTPSTTLFSVKVKKFTYTKFKSFKLHVSLFTSEYYCEIADHLHILYVPFLHGP